MAELLGRITASIYSTGLAARSFLHGLIEFLNCFNQVCNQMDLDACYCRVKHVAETEDPLPERILGGKKALHIFHAWLRMQLGLSQSCRVEKRGA